MEIYDLQKEDWDLIIGLVGSDFIKLLGLECVIEVRDFYMGKKNVKFTSGSLVSHVHYAIKSALAVPFREVPLYMCNGSLKDAVCAFRLKEGR